MANNENSRMLLVEPVNEMMEAMAQTPEPAFLYENLWYECEVACLFARSGLGKSIFSVQIAEAIAAHQPVLYLDCELTRKQFQIRYTNRDNGNMHRFPDNFYRVSIQPDKIGNGNFEDCILQELEEKALETGSRVLIIDNLTYVCNDSEKGEEAGTFMQKLKRLQMCHEWSILIIAHTPKIKEGGAISENHLAGSKKLFNFFDSVFALGKSKEGERFRYLKQLKMRSGEAVYTEDNVAVYELVKSDDGNLSFVFRKYDNEFSQLRPRIMPESEIIDQIVNLRNDGKSIREIAGELNMSKSSVDRLYKKYGSTLSTSDPVEADLFDENDYDDEDDA